MVQDAISLAPYPPPLMKTHLLRYFVALAE
jgi:hypothetical protein